MTEPTEHNQPSPLGIRLWWVIKPDLLWVLLGVVIPMILFAAIAAVIESNAAEFGWEEIILLHLHRTATASLDQIALNLTPWGGIHGTSLLTGGISLLLLGRKKWRAWTYLMLTLGGAGLITLIAKILFHRLRPSFWPSLIPQSDFSFPSGHATDSMALVAALIILSRGSRWVWLVLLSGTGYVFLIAWTRLYLGVHYPSDILVGWLVAVNWAISVSFLVRPPSLGQEPSLTVTQ